MAKTNKATDKNASTITARVAKNISPLMDSVVSGLASVDNFKAVIICSIARAMATAFTSLNTRKLLAGDRKSVYAVKYSANKDIREVFRARLLASLKTKLLTKAYTLTEARKLLATKLDANVSEVLTRYVKILASSEVYFSQVASLALGRFGKPGVDQFTKYATANSKSITRTWIDCPIEEAIKLPKFDPQTGKKIATPEKLDKNEGGPEQKLMEAIDKALQQIPETETREGIEALLSHLAIRANAAGYTVTYTIRKQRNSKAA